MLQIPTNQFFQPPGRGREQKIHIAALANWIEASTVFVDGSLSSSDVADVLFENDIYDQGNADEQASSDRIIEDAFSEIGRRSNWLAASSPFQVQGRRIRSQITAWDQDVPYSFCMTLAMAGYYTDWASPFGNNYNEQGRLFEELTGEALRLYGWTVLKTGWNGASQPADLERVIVSIAASLGDVTGNVPRWKDPEAKDGGLDLVCYKPFADGRGGKPVFLTQCASGANWIGKLHQPDIELWKKFVDFSGQPQRAFAMPFALSDDDFRRRCLNQGMFLDRYRLLSVGRNAPGWVSDTLKQQITIWLTPRLARLPTDAN